MEDLERRGIEAYHALGRCTRQALREGNLEYAVLCSYPLLKLADIEGANYFGASQAGEYNYNTAHDLAKEVIQQIDKEGRTWWFKDEIEEMRKILKDKGW